MVVAQAQREVLERGERPRPGPRGMPGRRGRSPRGPPRGGTPVRGGRAPPPRRRRGARRPPRSATRGAPRWPGAPSRRAAPPPRPARATPARSRWPGTRASPGAAPPRAGPRGGARGRPRRRAGPGRTRRAAGRRPSPAKWSSRSTWVDGSSRPCGSCWPWMTVRRGARSRSRLTGTRAPLTVARPLPLARSSRRTSDLVAVRAEPALLEESRRLGQLEDRLDRRRAPRPSG